MKRTGKIGFIALLPLFFVQSSTTMAEGFEINEIVAITKDLGKKLECPDSKIGDLIASLREAVKQDLYKKNVA